jgi:hypothetical protein
MASARLLLCFCSDGSIVFHLDVVRFGGGGGRVRFEGKNRTQYSTHEGGSEGGSHLPVCSQLKMLDFPSLLFVEPTLCSIPGAHDGTSERLAEGSSGYN